MHFKAGDLVGTSDVPISVILADDQLLIRRSIRELLLRWDIVVAGEASNGLEAVKLAAKAQPDVAVLDAFTPLLNGLEAGKEILKVAPRARVVLLSLQARPTYLREGLAAGISGFVSKSGPAGNLEQAIRRVAAGAIYLDSIVGSATGEPGPLARDGKDGGTPLTARERQVVQMIAECRTTKEIANLLDISTKTAESHRQRAMSKLNLSQPAQLVRYAIRKSLVQVRIPPSTCRVGREDSCPDALIQAASAS